MPELSRPQQRAPGSKRERNKPLAGDFSGRSSQAMHPVLDLAETAGNGRLHRLFQSGIIRPKLKVSQPGDAAEREVHSVGDQVTRMPSPEERSPAPQQLVHSASGSPIQRMCSGCQEELEGGPVPVV
jgi:hypothetical protein